MKKVVFIDRDGTIIREPADKQIDTLEKLEFIPGIVTGLRLLADAGFTLVMVSNQDGLGTRTYPRAAFNEVQGKILRLLEGEGIVFEKIFICPHYPQDECTCRKPKLGLVKNYLAKNSIDYHNSFMFGDRQTDIEFAANLGVRGIQLSTSSSKRNLSKSAEFVTADAYQACEYIFRSARSASIERTTNETSITARVSLDGSGSYKISTGIGFFDHMLSQLARHSKIDLVLEAKGDLHIDEHHTVEDTGIVLGELIRKALGSKRGINRFAFAAPLDEALAQVTLDLSGRRHCTFDCPFKRERIGDFPTELAEDFFRAFADGLAATLHISCRGRNEHHKIEAIFKAVAVALRSAIQIDRRALKVLPSTKGML